MKTVAKCRQLFCTYCSRHKDRAVELLPARRRRWSKRIDDVARAAAAQSVRFFILSGKKGLVAGDDLIEDYGHLLRREEVDSLVDVVVGQLKGEGVPHLTYFTKSPERHQEIGPYLDLIQCACTRAEVVLELRMSEDATMPNGSEITEGTGEAKKTLIASRSYDDELKGLFRMGGSPGSVE